VLQAVPGSTHGYDVVDHSRLSDDLGGPAAFDRMVDALQERGLSIVLDTVPNHMALAGSANRWWWDVLEDGPASPFADHFDIQWGDGEADGGPSVLMPVLGDHLGRVLEEGTLELARRGGAFVVRYHEHELPLSPRSIDEVLSRAASRAASTELAAIADELGALPHAARTDPRATARRHDGKLELRHRLAVLCQLEPATADAIDEELARVAADPDALDALLARQNYRLASWRTADEALDYRRFFSIPTLAGIRVEDDAVFDESHRLLVGLLASGRVSGLRIDHIDGLRDPAGYLDRLAAAAPDAYLVVEKILQHGERLPDGWPVAGTSGYDHLNAVNDLFVDPAGEAQMTERYVAFVGDPAPFADIVHDAKIDVVRGELAAETERLTDLLAAVCRTRRRHRDHTRRELRDVLEEVLAAMAVYRTYVVPGEVPSAVDREHVLAALEQARTRRPDVDGELLDLVGRALLLDEPGVDVAELAVRFQQLSAPVMAKGVEDTAFYRYHRLTSLNEVGGDPGTFGQPAKAFHDHCRHLVEQWPHTMLTLATHDTKRSADVRARINVLSEVPEAWGDALERWAAHNDPHRRPEGPDRPTEVLLYQTLVGTWPIEEDRLVAAMVKSAREAKLHTSWSTPNAAVDDAVAGFTADVVRDAGFVTELEAFLAEHRIVERGQTTSLAQAALLVTAPGIPDLYQGSELWDLSLVDPDNRRPVDHEERARLLRELLEAPVEVALDHLDDGGAKLWLLAQLLRHRRLDPAPYRSSRYDPLEATGAKADHVVAFQREGLLVVVPRLLAGLAGGWDDTELPLPAGAWSDLLTGSCHHGSVPLAHLLGRFPVSVLVPGRG
jgi:(1->4)-alpha-D-glucan 1-alpha-D-glucosylmutase